MKLSALSAIGLSLASAISALPAADYRCDCSKPLPEGIIPRKSKNLTLPSKSGVSPRRYRLHLPEAYDGSKNVPLILSFHGRTRDAKNQEKLSQFSNASYGFEGIAVYPEGVPLKKNGSVQQWQGDPDSHGVNDVKFILEILDELEKTYCIDKSRIYAAGKSNGGGFTGLLACDADATKRITAFAPVSGAFYLDKNGKLPECNPSRKPIPLMEFHGWADDTIEYLGGINNRGNANSTNIITYVDDWAKRDGFTVNANRTSYLCGGNQKVTRYSWDDTIVHYNYTNLKHDWPSSFPNPDTKVDLTCKEAEATPIILDWFKKWKL